MDKKKKFTEKGKAILERTPISNLNDFFEDIEKHENKHIDQIPVEMINPNPNQARKYFNDTALEDLSRSIQENGVLQPVLVRKNEDGKIILVAGERRLRASVSLGNKTIPAIYVDGNPLEISLIENIQRENLSPMEEAEAYSQMINEFNYTQQQLSKVIGKARSTIAETISLTRLPESVKQSCRHADIPKRTLIEVAKAGDPDKMIKLFNKITSENLSSDNVRKITRKSIPEKKTINSTILKTLKAASRELTDLQIKNLTEQEYMDLMDELNHLKSLLNNILS